jgi:hypothetical protein
MAKPAVPPAVATEATASAPPKTDEALSLPPEAAQEEAKAKDRMSLYEDMSQALLPVKDYVKYLEEQKIEESKAAEIVDDLITKGYHEEEYTLTKRSSVVLRTREHLDTLRLHAALQAQQPIYNDILNEVVVRYNVASSLAAINGPNGIRFEFPAPGASEADANKLFDVRMRYIERMPGVLFAKISVKLSEFDRLILSVMREGVAEHF